LCLKGLYGWEFVHSSERLQKPLIRKHNGVFSKDGLLEESEWDEALDLLKEKIGFVKKTYGPDSFMGLSSARCTNEENYIFQKFFRQVLGTNNVDHCARL
jgi:predicted molibdopterin-dependent oxidoreductase YjgC